MVHMEDKSVKVGTDAREEYLTEVQQTGNLTLCLRSCGGLQHWS